MIWNGITFFYLQARFNHYDKAFHLYEGMQKEQIELNGFQTNINNIVQDGVREQEKIADLKKWKKGWHKNY